MNQILARHHAYEARVQQAAGMVQQANAAARAAAQAASNSIHDGLGAGGLNPVTITFSAAQDPKGLATWQGADKPTEATSGTTVNVTVNQTDARALLSWNSFNVGPNTVLNFDQHGNADWIAVNRVVGGIDPVTGLLNPDLGPTPSQILGSIRADGTVYVLNRAGVMFGAKSQVNLHSLLASSLELGSATVPGAGSQLRTLTLADRNSSFLSNGVLQDKVSGLVSAVAGETHGDVVVGAGAQINATGGYVILAGPKVSSAGEIKASAGGQVSLQAGTQVDATVSTGAAGSADPYVRGLLLASVGGGTVDVSGSIDAAQGYISLGGASVTLSGVLSSTTSVSRNGKISITGNSIDLLSGSAISIIPDTNGATIPQSADSVAGFKNSQIDIGGRNARLVQGRVSGDDTIGLFDLLPSSITMHDGAIIEAPNATVSIGGKVGGRTYYSDELGSLANAKVDIQGNSVIDVAGVADVQLNPSRNVLEISPAKRNELRDTPNYRDPTTDGSFTLNGQTLFVDPRLSGVRSDGVAWIGSPLIEAGSLAAQIGVTAPELMTKGGTVTLATSGLRSAPAVGVTTPFINISSDATIDFSGGWVRYAAGSVHYSKLLTDDGRVIDIGKADPNDNYVAVGDGYVEQLPQLTDPTVYANSLLQGSTYQQAYVEGRDAGALTVRTPTGTLGGILHGDAVAGVRQLGNAAAPTATSNVKGDIRKLQGATSQLAAGGLLHVESLPGAAIEIGKAPVGTSPGAIFLNSDTLNEAHLGGLSLQTTGAIGIDASSDLKLAPGGAVNLESGRSINFKGSISAPAGSIVARTYGTQIGNLFDTADDLPIGGVLAAGAALPSFDITVENGASLSVRGRWVNDSLVTDGLYDGAGYTSGGSITLQSAPHVSVLNPDGVTATDLSGSILLQAGSLLDASGGGYVSPAGVLQLDGKGGDVSLINNTSYFQQEAQPTSGAQIIGGDRLRSDLTSFQVTSDLAHPTGVVPTVINATVAIDGEIRSFGYKGGGTFTLVTPDLKFGSSDGGGTAIGLDFLQNTGFGTLSLSAWNTTLLDNVFSNGIVGKTAILSTDKVQIRAGETLNLTQSILPSILGSDAQGVLGKQVSGTDISRLDVAALKPTDQLGDWDNRPANLILGGLTELENYGTIIGAPQASITAPKIYNGGTIRIAGGSLIQKQQLPFGYSAIAGHEAIAIRQQLGADGIDHGAGLATVFGPADANGLFDEDGSNALGISGNGAVLSNRDLVSLIQSDRQIYYLGQLDAKQGILLDFGSVTDLSGISIRNPRSPLLPGTVTPTATGRMIAGGTISTAGLSVAPVTAAGTLGFTDSLYGFRDAVSLLIPRGATPALSLEARSGATIDISGAADRFDVQTGANSFTPVAAWSNAGTISALGGGDISQASIDAHGGALAANGGTLEWLNPVLIQAAGGPSGTVAADQLAAAGFDSFIARGHVTTLGDVNLNLARSFLLRAPDFSGAALSNLGNSSGDTKPYADPYYAIGFSATGDLSINAAHIGLLGVDQTVGRLTDSGAGTFALHGGTIDVFGAVSFGNSLSNVLLDSAGDIRLIGVQPIARTLTPSLAQDEPSLSGQLVAGGNLTLRASQVYATSGTGNLQALIESKGQAVVRPYLIASAGDDTTVRVESNGQPTPGVPYSAGSYLFLAAPHIEQAGVLRAPLGRIDLGSTTGYSIGIAGTSGISIAPTKSVRLEDGSLTTVSAGNLSIPYGTTTDLTEYFFAPGSSSPLTAPPAAELRMSGGDISVAAGAIVDATGGSGDIYAYEFVSGTGGSRDVLSRFNNDAFSSNNGYQYPDARQVYAIVPAGSSGAALYDPIYSADYGALYAGSVGQAVHLEGGNGVAAGDYLLLPAQYAMLPGAMRLVENVGGAAPLPGTSGLLLDGSVVVAGTYEQAGTGKADWQRRSFTVQSQDVFKKYSRIELTSGTDAFTKLAGRKDTVVPRLPSDAARIVLNPLSSLSILGTFLTTPGEDGRGSQVDIAGELIDVVSEVVPQQPGRLSLLTTDLDQLNAASLLIGGIRTDLADGSTNVRITAKDIRVATDALHPLEAPEVLLAVDGIGSSLTFADGAVVKATGTLSDQRSGDYNVAYYTKDSSGNLIADNSGAGAVFRLANGPERAVNRSGELAASVTSKPVTYSVGQVTLSGDTMTLDTSRQLDFDASSTLDVRSIGISGDNVSFSSKTYGLAGLVITPELEQAFASAEKLSVRANNVIGFTGGEHAFHDLSLNAPGVRLIRTDADRQNPLTVTLNADTLTLSNSTADAGTCRGTGGFSCGTQGNSLFLDAQQIVFGSGTMHSYGFGSSVTLSAANGVTYTGRGAFDVGAADLSIKTPYIVEQGAGTQPTAAVHPALELRSSGDIAILSAGLTGTPTGPLGPGARLAIGSLDNPANSVTIDGALLRATAGTIEAYASGNVDLTGGATLATQSYKQTFGDAADPVTVSAGGGTVSLVALHGDLNIGSGATLSIGGLSGSAGRLNLLASQGAINLAGTLDGAAPNKGASLFYDSGKTAFNLTGFLGGAGANFTGDLGIRTGAGDLSLAAGQTLNARSVNLTADGGSTLIGGIIDTSGINGGDIGLFASDKVALLSTAKLDAHAIGYADTDTRRASGGDVTLGVGEGGTIKVDSGAVIELAAGRKGDRLVGQTQTDPRTLNQVTAYTYVEADQGGTLTLRAPIIQQAGSDTVDVGFAGAVNGAREITLEAYQRYDLGDVADNPLFTGVSIDPVTKTATLDLAAVAGNKANFLSDLAPGSLVDFIQNFDVAAARPALGSLTSDAAYHERPGVELDYNGNIALASNWNLGAGSVDVAAAVAAGDMRLSTLPANAGDAPRYEVVPGHEEHLFQNFVDMTYRVGGSVEGAAGRLTLRAGGDLALGHSISDGFFAFADQSDPAYLNSQLGGGVRTFSPAISAQCGTAITTCADVVPFVFGAAAVDKTSIDFNLSNVVRGQDVASGIAPYSKAANDAAASGLGEGGAGDPFGTAQLFPLLADGTAVDSFGIRLVGGAGDVLSANPLHVDRGSGGSVIVSGETQYAVAATRPSGQYGGPLQIRFDGGAFLGGDYLAGLTRATELDSATLQAATARVLFGAASPSAAAFMKDEVAAFFAAYPDQFQYIGSKSNPTGFAAPVGLVLQFLQSRDASGTTLADRFAANVANGSFGFNPPSAGGAIDPAGKEARVRTMVRTGIGSIDVAAGRDVDLRNGDPLLLSANNNKAQSIASNAAQAGGGAIYTAGHLVAPHAITARIAGTNQTQTIDPSAYALTNDVRSALWVPTSDGRLQVNPVYATGGGSIGVTAGGDVLGRRDVWSEAFNSNVGITFARAGVDHPTAQPSFIGAADQRWRVGAIGVDPNGDPTFATNIRINDQLFSSGIGTLGGGDISIDAAGDVSELTVALDTSVTTGDVGSSFGSMVFGGGNLTLNAGRDILGGRFDIATGVATISAGRDIASSGDLILRPIPGVKPTTIREPNLTEIRTTDAAVDVRAGGSITLGKVSALGVDTNDGDTGIIDHNVDQNALGYLTANSSLSLTAPGNIFLAGDATDFLQLNRLGQSTFTGAIMPASLQVTSFAGDIDLGDVPLLMVPSARGQLSLLAGGTIAPATIDLDDSDASLMPGIFSALNYVGSENLLLSGRPFSLPVTLPTSSDALRRLYHADTPVHEGDTTPVRIAVGGSLVDMTLFSAKSARISAGDDISNMMFVGQNLSSDDVTRVVAGRDITATTAGANTNGNNKAEILGRALVQGNQWILGGPGALYIEAGRDLGPFVGSSTVLQDGIPVSYPGGILAVGNDFNRALGAKSADVYAFFGVGKGMDFASLRETYVNPANAGRLDSDLFEQVSDPSGNLSPDRTKPIYSPILIAWMQANQPDALKQAFGTTDVNAAQAYTVFAGLPELVQRKFLLANVYFNELQAPSRPGVSYLQYVRGYRAVDTLFPASLGYTANDLSGTSNGGTRVSTGNLDLRLATVQTTRGGDVTILGPGGDAILGSVVRTSAQADRRAYQPGLLEGWDINSFQFRPLPTGSATTLPVSDIPIGYEGVLTLRGGAIRGFTDGDIRLNQSRLFSQNGGDITLWSSNGDLNAGQGPKSGANVPPVVVRFDPNGTAEVDTAGAVAGAGIAGFAAVTRKVGDRFVLIDPLLDPDLVDAQTQLVGKPDGTTVEINGKTYRREAPTISLIAPVGTVDAGDAGVRAGGDIFVAAAQVANADNFKVGGQSIGIPSTLGPVAPVTPASAAAVTANAFRAAAGTNSNDQKVRILVDVLGYYSSGSDDQCDPKTDKKCPTP